MIVNELSAKGVQLQTTSTRGLAEAVKKEGGLSSSINKVNNALACHTPESGGCTVFRKRCVQFTKSNRLDRVCLRRHSLTDCIRASSALAAQLLRTRTRTAPQQRSHKPNGAVHEAVRQLLAHLRGSFFFLAVVAGNAGVCRNVARCRNCISPPFFAFADQERNIHWWF